jgi:formate/nitrite transporter FocA (FNT family)
MALEALGRSVDRLIVDTSDNLEATRTRTARRQLTELYFWRATAAIALALMTMLNIEPIVRTVDSATGVHKPTALLYQSIFGLGFAVIAFAFTALVVQVTKLYRGVDMPAVERAVEVFVPLIAGLAGAALHQG